MSQKVVPIGPGSGQIRYAEDRSTKEMVQNIQGILECRPVTTVRVILDFLGPVCQITVGKALPICGYMFANGPWKKALIKFGMDPRAQPDLRFYQTITFDMEFDPVVEHGKHDWTVKGNLAFPQLLKADDNIPHIFNGTKFVADDNTWQICDITDEILQRVIATSEARLNFSNKTGFFMNGTMAKIMVIMRDRLLCIKDNLLLDDKVYECLLGFPDEYMPPKERDIRRYGLEFGQHYTTKQAFLKGRIVAWQGGSCS
ncbi:RNA polymerase III transcription factor IIIC subunit-domain-containing protein [Aspergillus keveii]|uniref:RNA polymerase III transcription factor IIIC subunit-domain-containing protein n=1 Tax=Aspergillus keveii TaxID=714993 RepID=A0ABR4G0K1_9EURO